MDESTPLAVAKGTAISCTFVFARESCPTKRAHFVHVAVTGGLVAGTYGLIKVRDLTRASVFSASAALNCGIVGATFFSMALCNVLLILQLTPLKVSGSML